MSAPARVVLALLLLGAPALVHAVGMGQSDVAAKKARSDFSGTWILDVERSWIGVAEKERLPAETLNVRQTETTLVLDADPARDLGVSSIPLPEPGRATAVDGTQDVQSRRWDGRLVVTTGWGRGRTTGVGTVLWSLSPDGNELTLNGTGLDHDFSRPNATVKTDLKFRRVYRRQR